MRSIGRIIAENRKKKGLSQPELAELLSQQGIDVTAKATSLPVTPSVMITISRKLISL